MPRRRIPWSEGPVKSPRDSGHGHVVERTPWDASRPRAATGSYSCPGWSPLPPGPHL
jgi:hypothetical protein